MTIREYAKIKGFKINGKLTRHPEWEEYGYKHYADEGGNEYILKKGKVVIVTADDAII